MMRVRLTFVVTCLSALSLAAYQEDQPHRDSKCERITVPLCSDVPYNYTRLPNMLNHIEQEKVAMDVAHFEPLIHTSCSAHVKFFVCSIYTPMCTDTVDFPITSCRSVCEEVKKSCLKILTNFGLKWPEMLNCSKFPQKGQLCMEPTDSKNSWSSGVADDLPPDSRNLGGVTSHCPKDMLDLEPTNPSNPCTLKCGKDLLFAREHKEFAQLWMAVWASICLIVTAFTVVTYLLDTSRFRFPEKSIVYLASCYHFYSWAYVVRLILGFETVACQKRAGTDSYLISGELDNPVCVLTFMALYYFSMASALWWVLLTFTWYLSAGKKWGAEAIEAWSSYFHFIAWGIPALLSIAVLITHKVDANELTGLCLVGHQDPIALASFVLGPGVLVVLIGCCFILFGFLSLCSVRKTLRTQGTKDIGKLEKLMVKIGIFSVLYVVPAVALIGCDLYHTYVLWQWQPATTHCKGNKCKTPADKPQVELYMLKIFMSLIVGITSGMWVTSRKTCVTWQRFLCCGHLRPAENKLPAPQQMPLMNRYPGGLHPMAVSVQQNSGSSYTSAGRKYPQRYFGGSSDASRV